MSVAANMLSSWRHPRQVMRRLLDAPQREDKALAYLMAACLILFVAQWPRLARAAHLDPTVPLDARLGGALLGILFLAPPLFYLIAGGSRIAARSMGGQGSYYSARLALFWALLASGPAILFHGLCAGFLGDTTATRLVGIAVAALFLFLWTTNLREAERPDDAALPIKGAGHAG